MGSYGLPALAVKPPEQGPNALDMYRQMIAIKGAQQQQQLQGVELQKAQQQQKDMAAYTAASQKWDGKDPKQLHSLILQSGGSGQVADTAMSHYAEQQQKFSAIAK